MRQKNADNLSVHRNNYMGSAAVIAGSRHMAKALMFGIVLLGTLASTVQTQAKAIREGDQAPDIQLLNESDQPIRLNASERSTVMTFIFTRCAAVEFCPKMNRKFETLQSMIEKEGLSNQIRLLSITLDPEFDRPERLKELGKAIKADPSIWNFATGSKAQIDALTSNFRVFRENKEGVLNHTLCTALIRPDGTVEKIWRGNYWKPEEVIQRIQ